MGHIYPNLDPQLGISCFQIPVKNYFFVNISQGTRLPQVNIKTKNKIWEKSFQWEQVMYFTRIWVWMLASLVLEQHSNSFLKINWGSLISPLAQNKPSLQFSDWISSVFCCQGSSFKFFWNWGMSDSKWKFE